MATNATGGASGNQKNDMAFNSWVYSMEMKLGCMGNNFVPACSIFNVPEQLRKSKVEAYTPKKVSIGPIHRGTSPDLIYMEEIKWRYMMNFFARAEAEEKSSPTETEEKLNPMLIACSKVIVNFDGIIRAGYNVDGIKFDSHNLAQIMLLDGCFLLELLVYEADELNDIPRCNQKKSYIPKREVVLSDLIVLGNQIPFIILIKLNELLYPVTKSDLVCIKERVLSHLGYHSSGVFCSKTEYPAHVLDLVHSFITCEARKDQNLDVVIDVDNEEPMKLKRCATKLEAAGIAIQAPTAAARETTTTRFDLNVTFDSKNKKLEIPPLHITETTETMWRNFISWEVTRGDYKKSIDENNKIGSIFIWYALFFQGLICSVHDIQFLRDRNVIVVNEKLMRDEDLVILFRNITKGVRDDQICKDSHFSKLFQELNLHPTPLDYSLSGIWYICKIIWHFCRLCATAVGYFFRNSYKLLIRDYLYTRWKILLAIFAIFTTGLAYLKTFFPHIFPN